MPCRADTQSANVRSVPDNTAALPVCFSKRRKITSTYCGMISTNTPGGAYARLRSGWIRLRQTYPAPGRLLSCCYAAPFVSAPKASSLDEDHRTAAYRTATPYFAHDPHTTHPLGLCGKRSKWVRAAFCNGLGLIQNDFCSK